MVGWKRPAECRICAYPVADGGVRMVQLDAEKVSEWWKQKLNAEFEYLGFEDQWICQFCLWEARYRRRNYEPMWYLLCFTSDWSTSPQKYYLIRGSATGGLDMIRIEIISSIFT